MTKTAGLVLRMALYPPPPDFYKLYGQDAEPPHPPPPVKGSYTAFGAEHVTDFVEPPFEQSVISSVLIDFVKTSFEVWSGSSR